MLNEQLFPLFHLLPEAQALVRPDGTIEVANRGLADSLGLPADQLNGWKLQDLLAEPAELANYLRACSRVRAFLPGSLVLRHSDGTTCAFRVEGALLQPASGADPALVLLRFVPRELAIEKMVVLNEKIDQLSREILRRQEVERTLREQREWLRTTLASIGDAVIAADLRGCITFMNPVAESLTGWAEQEALDQPLEQVFRIVNEYTRLPTDNPVQQVFQSGQVVGLANQTLLLARDGKEWCIDDSAAPIRDAFGHLTGVVLVFHDVTVARHAARALRESEERFRQLAEHTTDVFWVRDLGLTRILYVSPAYETIWGRSCQSLLDDPRSVLDSLHPDDRPILLAALEKELQGEPTYREYRILRPDGSIRWILDRGFPIRDEQGQVYRVAGIAEDITERKQTEQALREGDRRKDEFLAMLAHELRNPLAPIRTSAQVFRMLGSGSSTLQRASDVVERQVQHMVRLVDDLLDVSRITRGKITLKKESVDLAAVLVRALETSRPLIDARKHLLTTSLPEHPITVEVDATRLAQVVANVLNNAAKYTPEGGQIALRAEQVGNQVLITVRDNGVGIGPNLLPHIFDLFTQGDRSLARSEGGLGIGLTLVRSLVEMHGGTVLAFSEGPGKGTEIQILLPIPPDSATLVSTAPAALASPPRPLRRVLIVDDNEDAAESLSMLLTLRGHEVRTAVDGQAALRVAELFQPQAILLDIGLPGMDGYAVARALRGRPAFAHTLLIALSGYGQEDDRRRAEEAGFHAHLVKPTDPETLHRLLDRPDH